MPIIGTPVDQAASTENQCADQLVVAPIVTKVEGQPNPGRQQAARVVQGQEAAFHWTMRDQLGNPVDLTGCGVLPVVEVASSNSSDSSISAGAGIPAGAVKLRLIEALSLRSGVVPLEITGGAVAPAVGVIGVTLTAKAVATSGIYLAEWAVFNSAEQLVFSNTGYLWIERSQFALEINSHGPWSWQELKMSVRDSAPEDSYLNNVMEWDLAEVCNCLIRPIQWFNETQPPISRRYTTTTFPFREHWLKGAIGLLYEMAAAYYFREHVAYSAGGVALNDKAKGAEYLQLAQLHRREFLAFAKAKKKQLNADACFGFVGLRGYG